LDLCAAPGTKTIIISKRLPKDSFLISSDFSKGRLKQLAENKEKYALNNVFITSGDLINGLCYKEKFYSVLLDAPCSSMGTLKKNPEIRWQIDEERIKKEGKRQVEMLKKAGETVKKGGFLLYSVCSIEKEETTDVVEQFLSENKCFSKEKIKLDDKFKKVFAVSDNCAVLVKPNQHKGDGFFCALFRKKDG
ncbi:MAG: RsmB/NOP family class I SAM-dependent RNA methyltransferase, partial [Acidobacteria bacterium]|nr:RsmB/NOP family class I SAM-dependent RNA methyltransferase [Acidobacteriota bacterium]